MNAPIVLVAVISVSVILMPGPEPPESPPLRYSVKNLGATSIGISFGRDINSAGQVVGVAWGPSSYGILYSNGRAMLLRPLAGQDASGVNAINDSGMVVGNSNVRILAGLKRTRACT